ncbi:helix-turn-helix domain-containing protein [Streptomyces sp. DT2A-34]|uniref:helix-turn-helix domain-containing protein n=1 Tax=Streptomyces sp. DT2A-34 TaxID=3051182 RepID=UPI00265C5F5F|nr:helix-turn-helix domain-containing protein [Streptomyces sp. DT2A-34]MDO0913972.1 helix-turn-helix domain-containing protein [Streptomyces sp. DT2A-34]
MQERPLHDRERHELHGVGETIAASGGRPPTLVVLHSTLLLGHSEALRSMDESGFSGPVMTRLEHHGKRLLDISEEMVGLIADGYAEHRRARHDGGGHHRPIDALCTLITEPTQSWRRSYLTKLVLESELDSFFPASIAVTRGHLLEHTEATTLRIGRSVEVIAAPIPAPEPRTLLLCPAGDIVAFTKWLRRTVTSTTVYTRAVTFEEAPARYTATCEVLPLGDSIDQDDRVIDAKRLLWHRMLANQQVDYVSDYVEEVIGPILRLPEGQRTSLLETLRSLDRHDGSVRAVAAALNIHEKTVRHRTGRIESLTGLNALSRAHWPLLHRAAQLCAMFPAILELWDSLF